jgi:hypothetical protein
MRTALVDLTGLHYCQDCIISFLFRSPFVGLNRTALVDDRNELIYMTGFQ